MYCVPKRKIEITNKNSNISVSGGAAVYYLPRFLVSFFTFDIAVYKENMICADILSTYKFIEVRNNKNIGSPF